MAKANGISKDRSASGLIKTFSLGHPSFRPTVRRIKPVTRRCRDDCWKRRQGAVVNESGKLNR
jgi:hypothetical protein